MLRSVESLADHSFKLQHRISSAMSLCKKDSLLKSFSLNKDTARLLSLQGIGAGSWLDAIPTSDKFALKTDEFLLAACMRLGVPLPFTVMSVNCDCGAPLDKDGFHLLVCKLGGGPLWEHNALVSCWSQCLSELGIHHRKEPRNRYVSSDDRPDIIMYDTESGLPTDLDMSVAHPWSVSSVQFAAQESGFVAKKREAQKKSKYATEIACGGRSPEIVPLVQEHFGFLGSEAVSFLRKLSQKSVNDRGHKNSSEFYTCWLRRLSVKLQKCNALVLKKKFNRVCNVDIYHLSSTTEQLAQLLISF